MCDPRRILLIAILGSILLLASLPVSGQIIYGQRPSAGLDIISTSWKLSTDIDEVNLQQWAIPVTAYYPLKENLEAHLFFAGTNTTAKQLGQEYNLNGLTDMRLQVNHSFSRDRMLVGLGLNLPVGHKGLNLDEEWVVMKYLSQSFLSFPIRQLGEGFGVNLMAGGATELGEYRLGGTATLDFSGAYNAYQGEPDYNPGNSLILTVGLQRELEAGNFNGDLTFSTSGVDKQGNTDIFQRGDLFAIHGGFNSARIDRRYNFDAVFRIRGRNQIYDPLGVLVQQIKVYGNEFAMTGRYEWKVGQGWFLGPAAELRLIAGNELSLGDSTVWTLGANSSRQMTSAISLRLVLNYFTGSTNSGSIDLSGFQFWLAANGTF